MYPSLVSDEELDVLLARPAGRLQIGRTYRILQNRPPEIHDLGEFVFSSVRVDYRLVCYDFVSVDGNPQRSFSLSRNGILDCGYSFHIPPVVIPKRSRPVTQLEEEE